MWCSRKDLRWYCCMDDLTLSGTDGRKGIQECAYLFLLSCSAKYKQDIGTHRKHKMESVHLWRWPFRQGCTQVWMVICLRKSTNVRGRPVWIVEGISCIGGPLLAPFMSQNWPEVSLYISIISYYNLHDWTEIRIQWYMIQWQIVFRQYLIRRGY